MFSDDKVFTRIVKLEKANSDSDYFRQKILVAFPELLSPEFSLWQRRKGYRDLKEIPDQFHNVKDLCTQYKNVSTLCLRPKVRITFDSQLSKIDVIVDLFQCLRAINPVKRST